MSPIDSVFGPYFGDCFVTSETAYTSYDHFAPRNRGRGCNRDQQCQQIDKPYSHEHYHPGMPIIRYAPPPPIQGPPDCFDYGPPPRREPKRYKPVQGCIEQRHPKPCSPKKKPTISSSCTQERKSPCRTTYTKTHTPQTNRIYKDIQQNLDCIESNGKFVVKSGYSLSEIAQAFSKSTNGKVDSEHILKDIIELNKITSPDCIAAGTEIVIPKSVLEKIKK